MNGLRMVIAGVCAAAVAGACATKSSHSGSNSNWYAVCTSDADCGEALQCRCGECATPCPASGDCSCPTGAAEAQGDGSICQSAPTEANTRVVELFQNVDRACAFDSDCFSVRTLSISCGSPCGVLYPSNTGWASIEAEVTKVETDVCGPFFAAGCERPLFFGCSLGDPICVRGTCENSNTIQVSDPAAGGNPITCEERSRLLEERMDLHARVADRTCATDDDCTFGALDIRCQHGCASGPLSKAGAAALATELAAVETDYCPAFEAAGCVSFVPSCPPPPPAKCLANRCDYDILP